MKKTVSANIGGWVFNIEEDAYDILLAYLNNIESRLDEEDAKEVMGDIEARIAELFTQQNADRKDVIVSSDVENIIQTMGEPEAFGEKVNQETQNQDYLTDENIKKRVYRDEEEAKIAGVAAGLAHYFGTDPLWVRLGFVLFTIFGGAGILVYIILWLALPIAESASERLSMKGSKITTESIKNEIHKLKERRGYGSKNHAHKFRRSAGNAFSIFLKIAAIGAVLLALFLSIVLGYWLLTHDFIISVSNNGPQGFHLADLLAISLNSLEMLLLDLGVLFLLLGPVVGLLTLASKALLGFRKSIKIPIISAIGIWGFGILIMICFGIMVGRKNSSFHPYEQELTVNPERKTLYVNVQNDPYFSNELKYPQDRFWEMIERKNGEVIFGYPKLELAQSRDTSFHVLLRRESNGRTKTDAISNAKNIDYSWDLKGNNLSLSPYFKIKEDAGYYGQDVTVILEIPEGASVNLASNIERIAHQSGHEHRHEEEKQIISGVYQMKNHKLWSEDGVVIR
jgi:phage shock protein PspC (stress-responsive transcriptional regulator)